MSTISLEKLSHVKKLYYIDGFSMNRIAKNLKVSIDSVVYFMRHNQLKRRTKKESNNLCFQQKPLSFKIKKNLSQKDEKLKVAGVSLYWGEGYKAGKAKGIDFANSDKDMIIIFLKFIRKICGVDEGRLRVLLYCYSNQHPQSLINFWSVATGISKRQFNKPYVRYDYDKSKVGKMPHGLIHVRYRDKKLLTVIKDWIEELKN